MTKDQLDQFPFQTTNEVAARLDISTMRVRQLLEGGRVDGAFKSGRIWLIPKNWLYVRQARGAKPGRKLGKRVKRTPEAQPQDTPAPVPAE